MSGVTVRPSIFTTPLRITSNCSILLVYTSCHIDAFATLFRVLKSLMQQRDLDQISFQRKQTRKYTQAELKSLR